MWSCFIKLKNDEYWFGNLLVTTNLVEHYLEAETCVECIETNIFIFFYVQLYNFAEDSISSNVVIYLVMVYINYYFIVSNARFFDLTWWACSVFVKRWHIFMRLH